MFKLVVLSVVLAVAVADPSAVWGTGLATPLSAGWGAPWNVGVATPWAASIAAPLAAPVATVSVGGPAHWIKKRSIVAAPWPAAPLAATPLTWGRSWVGPAAPLAVAAPVAPWGLGVGARVGHLW
ncbi:uncharacterized protein LOC123867993 [Maniola jurtina]|uniref:uncharacterized protein LOC123867993 n=1 Tax=Maniola jurtina TaxID=191418 RepID=UPI001E68CA3A|nr:uncharacterized protein LOC123867993 [Maniola jurtina]